MHHETARPAGTLRLEFQPQPDGDKPVAANLSVVSVAGPALFAASDEGARIERLVLRDGGIAAGHQPFKLADAFDLPDGPDGEADIEGMSVDGGWLWVVGSHSLARSKPKSETGDDKEALKALTEVRRDPNRYLLGRIPLADLDGLPTLAAKDGKRRAGRLKMDKHGNALVKRLRKDEHIGRFIGVPAKENGFDVEGLAARGDRLFLGLRGPVLRGWACILELEVKEHGKGHLRLAKLDKDGARYRKHFLDLGGLGIRELSFDGDDLLILAGPTMDLDGPVRVHRWRNAIAIGEACLVPAKDLSVELELPYGVGCDHAEGIARLERLGEPPRLLVVYDSPAGDRLPDGGGTVLADLFELRR